MLLLFYSTLYAAILMLVAYGGMTSERSGVVNLGVEGIMVIGGLVGTMVLGMLPEGTSGAIVYAILASMAAGMLYSLLLAVAAVSFGADQTLVGTAMNMLATALAAVIARSVNSAADPKNISTTISFGAHSNSCYINLFGATINIYCLIAIAVMIVLYIIFNKTRFGLRLVSCGEHPQAAASVGISVRKMRYSGVLISGALSGLGGLAYVTASVNEWNFENGVAGFGFLALAVMIFGQWDTLKIAIAAVFFGLFRALSNIYTGIPFLEKLGLPSAFYNILPYAICLVVFIIFAAKSAAPKSAGIPYDDNQS